MSCPWLNLAPTESYLAHVHAERSRTSRSITRLTFSLAAISLAVLTGLLLCSTISSLRPQYALRLPLNLPPDSTPGPQMAFHTLNTDTSDHRSLDELRNIVAQTKGYWARDYSMNLGWNNMRYIIETALLHGSILNRTVILPSFVYARSCEHDNAVCADVAEMVNRNDAVHSDEWRFRPLSEQMAWRLPISTMLNLTHLCRAQPVVTVAEYLRLHNISDSEEESSGQWRQEAYHVSGTPRLHVIANEKYDPFVVNRVDVIPEAVQERGGWRDGEWAEAEHTEVSTALRGALRGDRRVLEWAQARGVLLKLGYKWKEKAESAEMERLLNENGWEVLYTYEGAVGQDYMKSVVSPIRQVALRQSLRSIREDYGSLTADVVLLAGEVHHERKPGSLRFTTPAQRDRFSRLVLYDVRAPQKVYDLAAALAARMQAKTGGRMWMGAHMRRGDFVRIRWAKGDSVPEHLEQIRTRLAKGRKVLRALWGRDAGLSAYDVPGVVPDRAAVHAAPPKDDDPFYLATDERAPENIAYLSAHGAVLASDLLTAADWREFGWDLRFTDVVGLVEQGVLARAGYFAAQGLSSFAGGVVNARAAAGLDPRTAGVD